MAAEPATSIKLYFNLSQPLGSNTQWAIIGNTNKENNKVKMIHPPNEILSAPPEAAIDEANIANPMCNPKSRNTDEVTCPFKCDPK